MLINNSATALSATILVLLLFFGNEIKPIWNGHLKLLLIWLSIIICACSVLANVGTTICITKDWVVVISGNDPEKLASKVVEIACEHLSEVWIFRYERYDGTYRYDRHCSQSPTGGSGDGIGWHRMGLRIHRVMECGLVRRRILHVMGDLQILSGITFED